RASGACHGEMSLEHLKTLRCLAFEVSTGICCCGHRPNEATVRHGAIAPYGAAGPALDLCGSLGLTFDMSGGPKGAKPPLARPLDGMVRRLQHGQNPMAAHQSDELPNTLPWRRCRRPPSARSPPGRTTSLHRAEKACATQDRQYAGRSRARSRRTEKAVPWQTISGHLAARTA